MAVEHNCGFVASGAGHNACHSGVVILLTRMHLAVMAEDYDDAFSHRLVGRAERLRIVGTRQEHVTGDVEVAFDDGLPTSRAAIEPLASNPMLFSLAACTPVPNTDWPRTPTPEPR